MEKIDFVITWVDGNDEKWIKEKEKWSLNKKTDDSTFSNWTNNITRFRDWGLLKYWFRGVEEFAPWVNNVFFITYGHVPEWLNTENKKIRIVKHSEYMPAESLPTFNSNAIELNMHRIQGLSDKFVYFNDDMFLLKRVNEKDFFVNGKPVLLAALDIIPLELDKTFSVINNTKIINKYFNKKEVIFNSIFKWINIKYGKHLFKTLFLLPWKRFSGLRESHVAIPYDKKYFYEIWEKEYDRMYKTTCNKFREEEDPNHWLVENWQILNDFFEPRWSTFGISFEKPIDNEILSTITKQKYKCICINDYPCSEDDFNRQRGELIDAFEKILPKKSSFEK